MKNHWMPESFCIKDTNIMPASPVNVCSFIMPASNIENFDCLMPELIALWAIHLMPSYVKQEIYNVEDQRVLKMISFWTIPLKPH